MGLESSNFKNKTHENVFIDFYETDNYEGHRNS